MYQYMDVAQLRTILIQKHTNLRFTFLEKIRNKSFLLVNHQTLTTISTLISLNRKSQIIRSIEIKSIYCYICLIL